MSGSCRSLPASAFGSEAISSRMEPSLVLSFANLAVSEPTEVCKFSQGVILGFRIKDLDFRVCSSEFATMYDVACACTEYQVLNKQQIWEGQTDSRGLHSHCWEIYAGLVSLLQTQ